MKSGTFGVIIEDDTMPGGPIQRTSLTKRRSTAAIARRNALAWRIKRRGFDPLRVVAQLEQGLRDFLRSSFSSTTRVRHGDRALLDERRLIKGRTFRFALRSFAARGRLVPKVPLPFTRISTGARVRAARGKPNRAL